MIDDEYMSISSNKKDRVHRYKSNTVRPFISLDSVEISVHELRKIVRNNKDKEDQRYIDRTRMVSKPRFRPLLNSEESYNNQDYTYSEYDNSNDNALFPVELEYDEQGVSDMLSNGYLKTSSYFGVYIKPDGRYVNRYGIPTADRFFLKDEEIFVSHGYDESQYVRRNINSLRLK